MPSASLTVPPGSTNTDNLSSSSLVRPAVNLYPSAQDQDDGQKNWGSGAKHGRLGQAPGAGQMGQPWDTFESGQRLLQGGQVGRGCWVGAHRWSWKEMWSWRDELEQLAFLKVKTFADSARDTEWKRQYRVLPCVCVFVCVCVSVSVFLDLWGP